MTKKLDQK